MSEFTASNGGTVKRVDTEDGGRLVVDAENPKSWTLGSHTATYLPPNHVQALREFFQHERDDELGWWRWSEHPEYVVWPVRGSTTGAVLVLNEQAGPTFTFRRDEWLPDGVSHIGAARAYFAAHPEPKPWHDAKPDEVWAITDHLGAERAFLATANYQFASLSGMAHYDIDSTAFVAGRRIWPEEQA